MTVRAKAKHNIVLSRPHPTDKDKKVRVKVKAGTHFDFTDKEYRELNAVNPGLLAKKGELDIESAQPAGMPVISETGDGDPPVRTGGRKTASAPEPADDDDAGDDTGDAADAGDDDDDL